MFAKIFSFILVYILSILNFIVVLSPLTFLILGKYFLAASAQDRYIESLVFISISSTTALMLLFLFFDFCFSSSVRYYAKRSVLATKDDKYNDISEAFEKVKLKFNRQDIKLYINDSNEVNAYAVGSLRKNIIVITTALLNLYRSETENREQFLKYVEGIMGHEISHIINKDYFTALLLIINERANNFVSGIIQIIFTIFVRIICIIPVIGNYISIAIDSLYNFLDFIINFFYKFVILNIYKFIQLQISKSIEYRADSQGAEVVGGIEMSKALSLLGDSGYFSIFSSHPSTKSRMNNVADIDETSNTIRPVYGVNLTFLLSFFILIGTCFWSYKLAKVDALIRDYYNITMFFKNKFIVLKTKLILIKNNLNGFIR